ncbi:MAG TPA: hypothetical protein ENK10_03785 [Acidobacteria bacterium]|nr:hypothetical protein [Acidobacteriota bacterium]
MSRIDNLGRLAGVWLVVALLLGVSALADDDRVTLRSGDEIAGKVLELDSQRLLMELPDGQRRHIPRAEVQSIVFGEEQAPPVVVRVKVYSADDEVRVFVNGEEVASSDELRGSWVDISESLHDGANEIRAEVSNRTNVWAYRWVIDAGGQRTTFACGIPNRSGCSSQGRDPRALGTMDAGRGWIYLHRREGTVEVETEQP